MALRNLRYDGDPILRKVSREVTEVTPHILELLDDMKETLVAENGVGLAAVQVGVLKRIFVIDVGDGPVEFINPRIVESDGEQTGEEGCLSIPNMVGVVTRPDHVICEAYDRNMKKFTIEGTDLLARAICHEYDHLDGVLYKDKAEGSLQRVQ